MNQLRTPNTFLPPIAKYVIPEKLSKIANITSPTLCRDTLIKCLDNNQYTKIAQLLCGCIVSSLNRQDVHTLLIDYAIINNDIDFINRILNKNVTRNKSYYNIDLSKTNLLNILASPSENIRDIFLNNKPDNISFERCIISAIKNNNISMLELLSSYGHEIKDLNYILFCGKISVLTYYSSKHDLQQLLDEFDFEELQYNTNVHTFSALREIGIDLSKKINDIVIWDGIENNDGVTLDLLKFCIRNYDVDLIIALNRSLIRNSCYITKYLLENGATINDIEEKSTLQLHIEIIKLLMDYNYNFTANSLGNCLLYHIKHDNELDKIIYLFNLVGNFDLVFENENVNKNIFPAKYFYMFDERHLLTYKTSSVLEILIIDNKLDIIKFMIEHTYDKIKQELNRLFIIAISNGLRSMVELLLEAGADAHFTDDLALSCAIFFGHYDLFIFLMKHGLELTNCVDNAFMVCAYGSAETDRKQIGYAKLIARSNLVFRNDWYHYGSGYANIFNFLTENNTDTPRDIFYDVLDLNYYTNELFVYVFPRDINMKLNNFEMSLLDMTISSKSISLIKFLLDNGAEVTNLAMSMAINYENPEIANLLREYSGDKFSL